MVGASRRLAGRRRLPARSCTGEVLTATRPKVFFSKRGTMPASDITLKVGIPPELGPAEEIIAEVAAARCRGSSASTRVSPCSVATRCCAQAWHRSPTSPKPRRVLSPTIAARNCQCASRHPAQARVRRRLSFRPRCAPGRLPDSVSATARTGCAASWRSPWRPHPSQKTTDPVRNDARAKRLAPSRRGRSANGCGRFAPDEAE